MPTTWPVKRKNITFVGKPNSGSFGREYVVSVLVILRDVLSYAQNSKDVKYILNQGEVLVNGRVVKDIKFACGLFDIFEIKKTKEKYMILFGADKKINLVDVNDNNLYLKVSSKTLLKGKGYQLNFMNGYNIVVDEKTFKSVNVNDTIVYDYDKKKVVSTIQLKEDAYVYVTDGNFKGSIAQIKGFTHYNGLSKDVVNISIGKEKNHSTAKDYCYVIGDKKEDIKRFQ